MRGSNAPTPTQGRALLLAASKHMLPQMQQHVWPTDKCYACLAMHTHQTSWQLATQSRGSSICCLCMPCCKIYLNTPWQAATKQRACVSRTAPEKRPHHTDFSSRTCSPHTGRQHTLIRLAHTTDALAQVTRIPATHARSASTASLSHSSSKGNNTGNDNENHMPAVFAAGQMVWAEAPHNEPSARSLRNQRARATHGQCSSKRQLLLDQGRHNLAGDSQSASVLGRQTRAWTHRLTSATAACSPQCASCTQ